MTMSRPTDTIVHDESSPLLEDDDARKIPSVVATVSQDVDPTVQVPIAQRAPPTEATSCDVGAPKTSMWTAMPVLMIGECSCSTLGLFPCVFSRGEDNDMGLMPANRRLHRPGGLFNRPRDEPADLLRILAAGRCRLVDHHEGAGAGCQPAIGMIRRFVLGTSYSEL